MTELNPAVDICRSVAMDLIQTVNELAGEGDMDEEIIVDLVSKNMAATTAIAIALGEYMEPGSMKDPVDLASHYKTQGEEP